MKILMINTVPTERNGITGVIMNIIRTINHEDIQIDLLSINEPDKNYVTLLKEYGGDVYTISRCIKKPLCYIKNVSRLIKKNKYDIVHSHGNSHTLALDLFAAWLGGCKIRIAHSHSTSCLYQTVHKLLTPLFNSCYTDGIACSKEAGKWLFGERRFDIINNGIDTKHFEFNEKFREQIRKKYNINEKNIVLGNIGDFHSTNKNQQFLVELIKDLHEQDTKYHLLLIGEGCLRKNIMEDVQSMGCSDFIHFTGEISEVNKYLSAMDFFLLPSKFEGLPLTAVEAQANGLQCFLSDRISESVDLTGNVYFFTLENEEIWKKAIINNKKTNSRKNVSRQACVDICDNDYDLKEECDKLKKMYCNLMKRDRL